MSKFLMCLGLALVCAGARAADQPAPATPAKPTEKASSSSPTAPAAKPAAPAAKPAAPAAKPAPAAPKRTLRTEAELTGVTSDVADQFYARVSLNRTGGPTAWYLRAGYGDVVSRSYTTNKVYKSEYSIYTLDGQYRSNGGNRYKFISATANIRNRSPYTVAYGDVSGYYTVSAGMGKSVFPGLETELALANYALYDHGTETGVTLVSSLRWQHSLTSAVGLTGHAYFIRPFQDDVLVDSRVDLSYKFTPSLSLRLSYVANNLLRPITSRTGWDKSIRVSLVFARTTF